MLLRRAFQIVSLIALLPAHLLGAPALPPLLNSATLPAPEKFVLAQALIGKSADLASQFPEETNRVLRATFLEALLTQGGTNIHRYGIAIQHALIPDPLDLRNAEVMHETSLIDCHFSRPVDFSNAVFEKGFSLAGSTFDGSVNFSSIKVGRIAALDRASFDGEVNATRMEVTGVLTARETRFTSTASLVDFTSLIAGGDAFFNRALFAGAITFQSVHIAENWRLDGAHFTNPKTVVKFEDVKVGAAASFVDCRFAGYVSFKDARFTSLDLSRITWPAVRDDHPWLWLNGMTYTRITGGSERDSCQNIFNLVQRTARGSAYSADVFTHLEDYYRKLGYTGPANDFFRAQKQREREEVLQGLAWAWSFFLDQFVGYGRSPERAIFWSVIIVAIGCAMFQPHRMEPQSSQQTARKYSPFWYSVDVYLPVIKLHDAEVWKPREQYVLTNLWRRIHTILGWALIPIAIAAWTGMLAH